jgi:tetratricopeptide (TPR) repeat protein
MSSRNVAAASLLALSGAFIALSALPARAADTSTTAEPATSKDPLAAAREQIAAKRWPAAIAELKKVNATGSADWNNLMGYSMRKQTPPDLASSERYYNDALRIDPAHRGTLEYSGELYLMKGDLPKAEQRLATLDKVCAGACEEYADLKKAIAAYKANGNRVVSTY